MAIAIAPGRVEGWARLHGYGRRELCWCADLVVKKIEDPHGPMRSQTVERMNHHREILLFQAWLRHVQNEYRIAHDRALVVELAVYKVIPPKSPTP